MINARIGSLILAGICLTGCGGMPLPPPLATPSPMLTLSLREAMIQTVDALAAARAHAAQRRMRACGVEAVFHVTALPNTAGPGTGAADMAVGLALAHPDAHEGPHSSTVTLTLAGENCDGPTPATRRRPASG